ncbi:hypothetical protein mRhiFer1_007945 [Rhinolophus ferrumequinum]|uniref:Uncharacterized protein n=1 Tax=Rhinolophus ferrumequinum TaxID=59479 RepID=A0A7J8AW76_RHIFE|nr:hypothetical protein mRhiFer1_007945 [Rhinolophus ferrumequinum]
MSVHTLDKPLRYGCLVLGSGAGDINAAGPCPVSAHNLLRGVARGRLYQQTLLDKLGGNACHTACGTLQNCLKFFLALWLCSPTLTLNLAIDLLWRLTNISRGLKSAYVEVLVHLLILESLPTR